MRELGGGGVSILRRGGKVIKGTLFFLDRPIWAPKFKSISWLCVCVMKEVVLLCIGLFISRCVCVSILSSIDSSGN